MRHIPGTAALPLLLALLAAPAWPEPIRISGRIEPAGAPGARVELHSYLEAGEALATDRPAADGSFALTAPDSGFYRVLIRADGVPDLEHPLVPLVDEVELPPVRLKETPGRIERFPGWGRVQARTPSAPPATLRTGRVLDAVSRQPVAGALVWQQFGAIFSWTRSGADGSFRIPAEAGRPIAAAAPGYARAVRPEVPPDAPVSLALKPAVVLTGRVADSEGRPVAGAAVRVVPTDPYPYYRGLRDLVSGFTREDGTFRLRGVPARSMLQVGAEAEGFAPAEQVASTGEPGRNPAPLRIALGPGSSLTGRLVDLDGQPIAGAEILLRDIAALDAGLAANPEEHRAVSDPTGRFRFEHLAGGVRHLRAGLPGAAPSALPEVEIPDRPGALDLGDLRLRPAPREEEWTATGVNAGSSSPSDWASAPEPPPAPGLAVSGRVTDPQGAPVTGADLLLHSFAAGRILRGSSAADGSFFFPQVPDGSYRLVARASGFADTPAAEVRLAGAPVTGLALRLEPGGTVTGRILGLAEHELPRVQVTAWRDGMETLLPLRALAGTDGRYRISGLPIGEWRITARRTAAFLVERTVQLKAPGEEVTLDLSFPEGVAVSGRVLLDGEPLAGAMVALGNARTDGRQARQTSTRADGSFAISAVEPGSYHLLVLAGGVKHVQPVEVPQKGELLIEIAGGSSR
ncbi:MAG TPA: carboxypeptidase-like regulatory domain-containing protein [Thermoanaerobaculia bacterium]|nr:carboxypeptidase-like regulatory domain-containing protein [Thermoanaerobaculia bacterium]